MFGFAKRTNKRSLHRKRAGLAFLMAVLFCLTGTPVAGPSKNVEASTKMYPYPSDNMFAVGEGSPTALIATENGYERVFPYNDRVIVEQYDDNFQLYGRKELEQELPICGGIYAGKDANYLIFGENNKEENPDKVILKVAKYSKNWKRLGTAAISGVGSTYDDPATVTYMFDSGYPDMFEINGKLCIACGHEAFVDSSVGQGHQGILIFTIDEATMTGQITDGDLNHSFSQDFASAGNDKTFILETCEGDRCAKVSKVVQDSSGGVYRNGGIPVLKYDGVRTSSHALHTDASADDIEVSDTHVLTVGSSIDQSRWGESDLPSNVYLTVTPIDRFTAQNTEFRWMTNHTEQKQFSDAKLTKVTNNRFLLSYIEAGETVMTPFSGEMTLMEASTLHYVFIDGKGNLLGDWKSIKAPQSTCRPIVKGNKIVYCSADNFELGFYSIDAYTGASSSVTYRIAGESAEWKVEGDVLHVYGEGKTITYLGWYINLIKPAVKYVYIHKGITEIGDYGFEGAWNVEEFFIEEGVKKIGHGAFWSSNAGKVWVPDSVTTIVDTPFSWSESLVCSKGSYAEKWAYENGIGCSNPTEYPAWTGKKGEKTKDASGKTTDISQLEDSGDAHVIYKTHVQTYGDESSWSVDGAMSGTSGKAKRLEAIYIDVLGIDGLDVQYTTHCQTYGWLPWSKNGEMNGTAGEAKRLEAIKIRLTGPLSNQYDIYYRVHAQTYGWLSWAKNGAPSGTAGMAKRLEGIQIVIVKKGAAAPGNVCGIASNNKNAYVYNTKNGDSSPVMGFEKTSMSQPEIPAGDVPIIYYRTHVQTFGWQNWVLNGSMSGTSGKAKRLEGIQIRLTNKPYSGGVAYKTHVQSYGWESSYRTDGAISGTMGKAKRLEAIRIILTGEMAKHYDIYYRVHAQSFGWLDWAKNGEDAGTAGYSKRLEGIQIVLVKKGDMPPSRTYRGVTSTRGYAFVQK